MESMGSNSSFGGEGEDASHDSDDDGPPPLETEETPADK